MKAHKHTPENPVIFPTFNYNRRTEQKYNRMLRSRGLPYIQIDVKPNHRLMAMHNRLSIRKRLNEACFIADNGKPMVYVEVYGMDCDCTQYSHLSTAPATFKAYEAWQDEQLEWADGPMHFSIMPEHEADSFRSYSRDLAMEAYEDGHPHVIYS